MLPLSRKEETTLTPAGAEAAPHPASIFSIIFTTTTTVIITIIIVTTIIFFILNTASLLNHHNLFPLSSVSSGAEFAQIHSLTLIHVLSNHFIQQ